MSINADKQIEVYWTAPIQVNGDAVRGYKVYIDDGVGGPYTQVFESFASTYHYTVQGAECGKQYFIQVTALNVAGEGSAITNQIWLGLVPTQPLNPVLLSVAPELSLTLGWQAPLDDGCLTILSYTINKDGVDIATDIDPSLTAFTDDISTNGQIGVQITYKLKAINEAGASAYSEDFTLTVGQVPNAPSNLQVVEMLSSSKVKLMWD